MALFRELIGEGGNLSKSCQSFSLESGKSQGFSNYLMLNPVAGWLPMEFNYRTRNNRWQTIYSFKSQRLVFPYHVSVSVEQQPSTPKQRLLFQHDLGGPRRIYYWITTVARNKTEISPKCIFNMENPIWKWKLVFGNHSSERLPGWIWSKKIPHSGFGTVPPSDWWGFYM